MILFKAENGRVYQNKLKFQFYNQIDGRLRALLLELGDFTKRELNVPVTITGLNRTKEENAKVNGSEWSAHLFGRAVDIRTSVFTEAEVKKIMSHIDFLWGDMIYVLHHNVGSGMHLHVNIKYSYRWRRK